MRYGMKRFAGLVFLPLLAWAAAPVQVKVNIVFSGNPAAVIKSVHQSFASLGYRLDMDTVSVNGTSGELHGTVSGIKPFSGDVFAENLKEAGVTIANVRVERGVLSLTAKGENAVWNAPLLGKDEGAELQKTAVSQWFRVEEEQTIRIQPPYSAKWYPEIAVMNSAMEVLYSFRSQKDEDEINLELPAGAYYLKVSNANGMKVLPAGMWIESISQGR